ncbi:hypothetical protein E2C01_079784 [Portunus trituberculatus]|uniref:Uncharacterized protein n=1 Tax=Portunus trituberculatus TaxID=210409 RepID=A0A5B7ITQ3_PORTR|nr:hypothetical protein [Portunus trituberculatus]
MNDEDLDGNNKPIMTTVLRTKERKMAKMMKMMMMMMMMMEVLLTVWLSLRDALRPSHGELGG